MLKKLTLKNGIRVVYEKIPYVNSITIGIWVGSGSRLENKNNNGVSHFIEHMMFKGTQNRTAKRIAEEIEELGGQINAFTGKEATCYYVKLLDEHYETGIEVLSDMILNPKFSSEDIEKEKGVIIEEINMYEDSPEDLVFDLLSMATWGNDSLALPILGYENTVKSISREVILDYYNKTYNPSNIVISFTGNFDEDKILELICEKFETWNSVNNIQIEYSYPNINNEIKVKNKDIEQVHVALTLEGIELGNDKLYTLLAINNYFGGGTSSRLFQKLREEYGYVYTIYSFTSAYKNKGMFNIQFALNKAYLEKSLVLITHEIVDILKNKMSDVQITKAKEQLKGSYILGLESVSSRMFSIGKSELMLNKVFEPKEVLNKIESITKDEFYEVIDLVFKNGFLSAALVGRDLNEEKIKNLIGDCNEIIHKTIG
ncbi:Predicted Zn-dependent peptidase [Caloramator fervidus]|uniref:Predicted Zn-dependent peptidase n=1 Tax=Caloramator fervidus TaxID=29344 RepID=A0A1H5S5T5_9CLOT|nr:pitrilysin family protein [Caloramator fervidus]SEF46013.1 Predicted Zn-dependent peptidase [Caloramator fervidus]